MAFVVLAAGAGAVATARALALRGRAAVAAELAALAAAGTVPVAPERACATAGELAARNGGRLVGCRTGAADVLVTVEVSARGPLGLLGPIRASARAGPV